MKPINYPIDFHPSESHDEHARDGLAALRDAVAEINEALAKVREPKALAEALAIRSAAALSTAKARLKNGSAKAASKTRLIRDQLQRRSEFERETREFIRTSKNPAAAVHKLIAAGDQDSVAAVFRAPPFLSGLDEDQNATAYAYAKKRFVPELASEEAAADDGTFRLAAAIERFTSEVQRVNKEIAGTDLAIAAKLARK